MEIKDFKDSSLKQAYSLALEIAKNLNNVKGIKKMELDLSPAEPSEVQLIINLLQSMFEATANLSEENKGVSGVLKAIRRSESKSK